MKMTTLTTVALLAVLGMGLTACGGGGEDGGGAVLEVTVAPSKGAFALGERIVLNVVVKNVSAADVAVATVDAALRVTALTRDAANVPATIKVLRSERDLIAAVDRSLMTLAPNGEATIQLTTSHTGAPDGQVLAMESMGATDLEAAEYAFGTAGTYSISISYRYQGVDAGGLPVHTEETAAGTASFTVGP